MRPFSTLRFALLGIVAAACAATVARAGAFEELLSIVVFEDELAYTDAQSFVCRHIATPAVGDFCKVTFRIVDPALCKVEIVRQFRATWGGGKGREFMLAKEVFTFGNLDLNRTIPEFEPEKKMARLRMEGVLEVFRHEGYQYAFDLDEKGAYATCRVEGASQNIPEEDCVRNGSKAPAASKKMSLLFGEFGYQKAIAALSTLQKEYCPSVAIKL